MSTLVDDEAEVVDLDENPSDLPLDAGLHASASNESREWFFTRNNPPQSEVDNPSTFWATLTAICGTVTHGVMQLERGDGGTLHWQGYFRTDKKRKRRAMSNHWRNKSLGGWVAPCLSKHGAIKYVTKDETRQAGPYYYGGLTALTLSSYAKAPKQGKRSDLEDVADAVKRGEKIAKIATDHAVAFIKYGKGIRDLANTLTANTRTWKTEVRVYYGASGTGKTYSAVAEARASGGEVWMAPHFTKGSTIFFEGYTGQENVVFDEYYGSLPIEMFLQLTDAYPFTVQVKGSHTQWLPRRIWFTSNQSWQNWYASEFMKNGHWKAAVERRITVVKEFTEVYSSSSSSSSAAAAAVAPVPGSSAVWGIDVDADSDAEFRAMVLANIKDNEAKHASKKFYLTPPRHDESDED